MGKETKDGLIDWMPKLNLEPKRGGYVAAGADNECVE